MTRVQIPAYTDRWMMGDRYGEIVKVTKSEIQHRDEIAHVRLDKSGKTIRVVLADCEVIDDGLPDVNDGDDYLNKGRLP